MSNGIFASFKDPHHLVLINYKGRGNKSNFTVENLADTTLMSDQSDHQYWSE